MFRQSALLDKAVHRGDGKCVYVCGCGWAYAKPALAPDGTDQEQDILRVNKIKYQF